MSSATHIIDWTKYDAANKLPLVIETTPSPLYINDVVTINLYCADDYTLISPYNGLSPKSNTAKPDSITETIELSGSSDISAKYPIKSVVALVTAIPLLDENTRSLIDAPLNQLVQVVNQQLKVADGYKLHGSIKLIYTTFNAQTWTHKAFNKAGNALLFAQNNRTGAIDNVPLSIGENTNNSVDGIRIEPWALPARWGVNNPYHAFVIYPANRRYDVVPSVGRVEFKNPVEQHIKNEEITFNSKEASTSYKIKRLIRFTGIFWDMNRRRCEPRFRFDNGVIKSDIECFGFGSVEYITDGLMYYYYANVNQGGNGSVAIEAGVLVVQDIDKKGVGATYTLPATDFILPVEETEFCKIYKKVIMQDDDRVFKVPPAWSSGDNTYPNYNGQDLPDPDKSFQAGSVVVSCKITSEGMIKVTKFNEIETLPFEVPEKYDIAENIPSNIDDSTLLSKMQSKINELKTQYGIA